MHGQVVGECGTRLTPQKVATARAMQAAGVYVKPREPVGGLWVPVTVHVVRRSDGSGGIPVQRVIQTLVDANLAFSSSGIHFCWPGPIDYIDSDDFYFNIDTQAEIDALRSMNVVADTVNIYFTQNLAVESGCQNPPCPLCGILSFSFSAAQGVVMANDCAATPSSHSTFPHELGHYFDLFHTYETQFGPECPGCVIQPCNCNLAGDLWCDTPADPGLGTSNMDSACNYFGTSTDPCSNNTYHPDTANCMSYAPATCRSRFSNQQNFRAQATLLYLRPDLISAGCPNENQWIIGGKLTAADAA